MNTPTQYPLLVFALSFIALWLSAWIGWWFRRRQGTLDAELREDFGFILAATLTLLGLIIGFSFSMATSRYDQRKNYEEAEANAIGTEYVRADLLPAADAATRTCAAEEATSTSEFCSIRLATDKSFSRSMPVPPSCRPSCGPLSVLRPRRSRHYIVGLAVSGMNDVLNSQGYTQAGYWNQIPTGGMGPDGGDRHRLQLAGRLWFAKRQGGIQIAADPAAYCLYRVHAHRGHRQPAPRHYSREAAKPDQPG